MKRAIGLAIISAILLLGCGLRNPSLPGEATQEKIPTVNQIFEPQADGTFLFETNDEDIISAGGRAYNQYWASVTEDGAFVYNVIVKKNYGDEYGGFGLIFQQTDETRLWFFDIDVKGYYCLGKLMDGKRIFVSDDIWVDSEGLLAVGYGLPNNLKVVFDGTTNYEIFSIDGDGVDHSIVKFKDNGDTIYGKQLRHGCFGISAEVMSSEHFPYTPVSVSFQIISPAIPSAITTNALSMSRSIGAR